MHVLIGLLITNSTDKCYKNKNIPMLQYLLMPYKYIYTYIVENPHENYTVAILWQEMFIAFMKLIIL